jgi:hypothetical protein
MPTFIPPTDNLLTFIDRNKPYGLGYRLFRFFAPTARGRNVFLLTDGTFTENEPADFLTIATTYYGGHIHSITAAESAALTAAGYGAYIT